MQPTQALAASLWAGGVANAALVPQPNVLLQTATNEQWIAMLTANARNAEPGAAPLYTNSVANTAPVYSAGLSDTNLLLSGYPFSSAVASHPVVSSNGYNPAELLSAATASPLFSNGAAQVAYSPNTVALINAIRQAAAAALPQQSVPQPMAQLVASSQQSASDIHVASNSRKRSANGDSDAQGATPSKRSSTVVDGAISISNAMNQAVTASAATGAPQIASTLAWLQQQQQAQQVQLAQQQTQLSSPPTTISLTPTTSPAVAIQTAALLRLQQQAQQNWAALFSTFGLSPLAFYDQLTNGLTMSSLTGNLSQNQALITSCPYFTEDGHLIESLQLCRDFQAGKCHRSTECRYVHIADTKGLEVNQGRVTVCRDAAKGRCTRQPCRYYHIPLQAISVNRSHALNNVLNNAAVASMTTFTSSATTTSVVTTAPQTPAVVTISPSASAFSSSKGSTALSELPPPSHSPSGQFGP